VSLKEVLAFIWVREGMLSFAFCCVLSICLYISYWVTMDWKEMLVIASSVIRRLEAEKQ